jgi:hypothetical protein
MKTQHAIAVSGYLDNHPGRCGKDLFIYRVSQFSRKEEEVTRTIHWR